MASGTVAGDRRRAAQVVEAVAFERQFEGALLNDGFAEFGETHALRSSGIPARRRISLTSASPSSGPAASAKTSAMSE